jgi:hypothetical protein
MYPYNSIRHKECVAGTNQIKKQAREDEKGMKRKTFWAAVVVVLFVFVTLAPASTSLGQIKPNKASCLSEPKIEKTWKYKYVNIYQLYDANFTYWLLSPGIIRKEPDIEGWMVGIFLKVTMTGTMKIEGTQEDTILDFKATKNSEAVIDAEDLGINDGDYIEINASVVITPYILPASGRILDYELIQLRAKVLNIDLKVYDETPQ